MSNATRISLHQSIDDLLDPEAHALRLFRMDVRANAFANREGRTFPKGPRTGCRMYLNRVNQTFGLWENGAMEYGVDILSIDAEILHTFGLTRAGFKYFWNQLGRPKVEAES